MCGCGDDHAESCEDQRLMQKEEVVAQPTERTSAEASHKIDQRHMQKDEVVA